MGSNPPKSLPCFPSYLLRSSDLSGFSMATFSFRKSGESVWRGLLASREGRLAGERLTGGQRLAVWIAFWSLLVLGGLGEIANLKAQEGKSVGVDEADAFFETSVRPVLIEHCYPCHSLEASKSEGNYRLDSRAAMLVGGTRGNSLSDPKGASLFAKAISYEDSELQMPPDGKLSEASLSALRRWLESGAVDPREESASGKGLATLERGRPDQHWAYRMPERTPLPAPSSSATARSAHDPIDVWIDQVLAEHAVSANPSASSEVLIRRLAYDLTGLPPTYAEIQDFVGDGSSEAYDRLVERLLSSPAFGERWARYWMDITRYADTKGYVFMEDRAYPHAYRYRDWLIRSFNQDMPYDQFVRYQLAADQLDPENQQGHLDAMGMLTLGRRFLNNPNDIADDRIDVVSRGLLGMTVSCARCHDHKYDPITMADYYSMHAAMVNSDEPGGDPSPMRLVDRREWKQAYVFLRGQPGNHGPEVQPAFVRALTVEPIPLQAGRGRLDLAEAIVSPRNPLTARVWVNRVWTWLFGMGLVDTPSDFGVRVESPVHQALLDRLAVDLMESGWSTKDLVRRLVRSEAYRRSSSMRSEASALDVENRWWWRANRRRMDLESYRDALLLRTEQLEMTVGGPSQVLHEPPYSPRRTLYAHLDRQNLPDFFRTFDFASPDSHSPRRPTTTVPQQGLFALNSDWMQGIASRYAARFESIAMEDREAVRGGMIQLVRGILARDPSEVELEQAVEFLMNLVRRDVEERRDGGGREASPALLTPWAIVVQSFLISNEFLCID